MDFFNLNIKGWNLSSNITTKDTVSAAINKATTQYSSEDRVVFHLDRGTQYAAKATSNTLKSYNIVQSMSRAGNCWDNAVAESFIDNDKSMLNVAVLRAKDNLYR